MTKSYPGLLAESKKITASINSGISELTTSIRSSTASGDEKKSDKNSKDSKRKILTSLKSTQNLPKKILDLISNLEGSLEITNFSNEQLINIIKSEQDLITEYENFLKTATISDQEITRIMDNVIRLGYDLVTIEEKRQRLSLEKLHKTSEAINIELDKKSPDILKVADHTIEIRTDTKKLSDESKNKNIFEKRIDDIATSAAAAKSSVDLISATDKEKQNSTNYKISALGLFSRLRSSFERFGINSEKIAAESEDQKDVAIPNSLKDLEDKEKDLASRRDNLKIRIEAEKKEAKSLPSKIEKLNSDYKSGETELKKLKITKEQLEARLKDLEPRQKSTFSNSVRNFFSFGTYRKENEFKRLDEISKKLKLKDDLESESNKLTKSEKLINDLDYKIEEINQDLESIKFLKQNIDSVQKEQKSEKPAAISNFDKTLREIEINTTEMLKDRDLNKALQTRLVTETERKQKSDSFENQFSEAFKKQILISTLVASGEVARDTPDLDNLILSATGAGVSLIPVAGPVLKAFVSAIQFGLTQYKAKQAGKLSDSASVPEMTKALELIAKKLSESYSFKEAGAGSPLDNLHPDAIQKIASYAAEKFIAAIYENKGKIPGSNASYSDIDPELVADAVIERLHQPSEKGFLSRIAEGYQNLKLRVRDKQTFGLKTKDGQKWDASGFFEKVGIITPEGEKFLPDGSSSAQYGFRKGSKEEALDLGFVNYDEKKADKKSKDTKSKEPIITKDLATLEQELKQGEAEISLLVMRINNPDFATQRLKLNAIEKVLSITATMPPLSKEDQNKAISAIFGNVENLSEIQEKASQFTDNLNQLREVDYTKSQAIQSKWTEKYDSSRDDIRTQASIETVNNYVTELEALVKSQVGDSKKSPQENSIILKGKMSSIIDLTERYGTETRLAETSEAQQKIDKKLKADLALIIENKKEDTQIFDQVKKTAAVLSKVKEGTALSSKEKKERQEQKATTENEVSEELSLKQSQALESAGMNLRSIYDSLSENGSINIEAITSSMSQYNPELIMTEFLTKLAIIAEKYCDSKAPESEKIETLRSDLSTIVKKGKTGKTTGKRDDTGEQFLEILSKTQKLADDFRNIKANEIQIKDEAAKQRESFDYKDLIDNLHERFEDPSSIKIIPTGTKITDSRLKDTAVPIIKSYAEAEDRSKLKLKSKSSESQSDVTSRMESENSVSDNNSRLEESKTPHLESGDLKDSEIPYLESDQDMESSKLGIASVTRTDSQSSIKEGKSETSVSRSSISEKPVSKGKDQDKKSTTTTSVIGQIAQSTNQIKSLLEKTEGFPKAKSTPPTQEEYDEQHKYVNDKMTLIINIAKTGKDIDKYLELSIPKGARGTFSGVSPERMAFRQIRDLTHKISQEYQSLDNEGKEKMTTHFDRIKRPTLKDVGLATAVTAAAGFLAAGVEGSATVAAAVATVGIVTMAARRLSQSREDSKDGDEFSTTQEQQQKIEEQKEAGGKWINYLKNRSKTSKNQQSTK